MSETLFIFGDQLLDNHPGLTRRQVDRVLMVESSALLMARPYHMKKLALLISAMRHYAGQLRAAGVEVDYRKAFDLSTAIRQHLQDFDVNTLVVMNPDSFSARQIISKWPELFEVAVEVLENEKMLYTRTSLKDRFIGHSFKTQEHFYRRMRSATGLLMEQDHLPTGGSWNFDKSNRRPLPKSGLDISPPIVFEPDAITSEVIGEVRLFKTTFGDLEGFNLAVDSNQAQQALNDFIENRLVSFGLYEDAMTFKSDLVFHSGISAYLNLGLLDPMEVCRSVEAAFQNRQVSIEAAEGFVRQVIGWREYMHFQYSSAMPSLKSSNAWNHKRQLPHFWWSGITEMNCMRHVLDRVKQSGYSHHIERLMILTNFAFMAEVDPQEVNEWFRAVYIDAYDWVVTPNVIGMGLNADGGGIATKPYFSSANYINRMSDYCPTCRFNPSERTGPSACPFNQLFWRKVSVERDNISKHFRSRMLVRQLDKMEQHERSMIISSAQQWLDLEVPRAK